MKVIYFFESNRRDKSKPVVKCIYGDDVEFISDPPRTVVDSLEPGDIIICNSVDDLVDYNAALFVNNVDLILTEYMKIYEKGIDLLFDKSTQCNSLFIKTLETKDQDFQSILRKCILNYLGQRDIEIKYRRAHVITAQTHGNKVGIKKGTKLTTKKSVEMKIKIKKLAKEFDGSLNDEELIKRLGISRNTYYKYKKEIKDGGE